MSASFNPSKQRRFPMNTTIKIALGMVAGLGIATSVAVLAQKHGPMMGHGPTHGYGPMMGRHMAGDPQAHLEALKKELKLTKEQQPAWQAFEKTVLEQAKTMNNAGPWNTDRHDPDAHIAFMEQRLAAMKVIHQARADLFKVLTPEQQSVFDQQYRSCGPHFS
jgi:hypothetical protein